MRFRNLVRWMPTLLAISLWACGGEAKHEEDGHDHHDHGHGEAEAAEHHEDRVVLTDEARAASGVGVASAGSREIEESLRLPGEIVPNADRLAHIVPRFPGITKQVLKSLGDEVRQGEPLALVESNESLSPYQIHSLISGTVIEKHITLGEFVRDDSDIYVVADLSTVWVNVTVHAAALPSVRVGTKARVTAVGGVPEAVGTIDYVGPVLGETSRAATARLVLPNPKREWRPGTFVVADLVLARGEVAVAVPRGAVQRFEGSDCVFVEEDGGFEPRPVRLGRSDGAWIEVAEGLTAGERYVDRGSFIIKSELMKSEAGHQH